MKELEHPTAMRTGRKLATLKCSLSAILRVLLAFTALTTVHSLAQSTYEPYTFITLAGSATEEGSADGTGSAARFNYPSGLAVDGAGNIYVADGGNHTIRKVTSAGVVTTLAGLAGTSGNKDGTGSAARFSRQGYGGPTGVAVDSAGNVYVADSANHSIRKVTPAGVVTTLAGLAPISGSADGTGSAARFWGPSSVAVDSAGSIYVADGGNHTIRKVTSAGVVTTLAGLAGSVGSENGTGSDARFWGPSSVAVDSARNLYVAEGGANTIRKVTLEGVVTTLAGSSWRTGFADGTGIAAFFNAPFGVAVDGAGNVYVADYYNNLIRKVRPTGVVTTLAGLPITGQFGVRPGGSADGAGSLASFYGPRGVAVDSAGNVYVADSQNDTIRKGFPPVGPPTILIQPQGQIAERNPEVPVIFSVLAKGALPLAYQWRKDGMAIAGATNSSLRLLNLQASDAGVYSVVVTNVLSSATSSSADLTTFVRPPQISGQPQAQTAVTQTYPVTWSVEAVGTTPLAYQWRKDGVNLVGATNAGYSIGNVHSSHTGAYSVVVSNLYGSVTSSNAVLTLTETLPYTFTTLAGSATREESADGMGSAARFNNPVGVAVDAAGNLYVADTSNNTIRKVTREGMVTTLAGLAGDNGNDGSSSDGAGSAARFNSPYGVAVDSEGNVYVADGGNHTLRKMTLAGVVTTLAGFEGIQGSADGIGGAARFNYPSGVAVDSAGTIYVADANNHTIRKVTPTGAVSTLAGRAGDYAFADGTASAARFWYPQGIALDNAGNVYVADAVNRAIRKINPAGVVTTLAGLASNKGSADGTGSAARFGRPSGVALDSAGNVYVADSDNGTIRKVTPNGVVTTLAGLPGNYGSADGIGSAAGFNHPSSVAVDSTGNIYVADTGNNKIRKVMPAGLVTTLAGLAGNDGTGTDAKFSRPNGVAVDGTGNLYVADTSNNTIRKVTREGMVTTLAGLALEPGSKDGTGGAARFEYPSGVAVDSASNVYVADTGNNTIRRITPLGVVTTLAGLAGSYGDVDGMGSAARFRAPSGIAVDSASNVYVADTGNDTIRRITPLGVVTTLAGLAGSYGDVDGMGSAARFRVPSGIAVDSAGNVYVADSDNNTIRKITPAGVVTTLAGLAIKDANGWPVGGSADGAENHALFNQPSGVGVDSMGNVYVTDSGNSTIRKVTPKGVVTTLAGLPFVWPESVGSKDGTGGNARFGGIVGCGMDTCYIGPYGIAVDSAGNLYVADTANNTIRKGYPAPIIVNSGRRFGFHGGQFGFDLTGPTGQSVVMEVSSDLVNWLPIWTNTFTGILNFTDPGNSASPHGFYRTRMP